ncbi:MAG: hypothetical protein GYA55_09270 [SAR324 cluster bacterium]|uniref:Acyl-ACP thioesterase n=1 Tax=SAR324 cluster bacterium TaxID=2024889 RepID=A0A7X9IJQ7_9DELT|nr:hypothetical protein [SAR324 cluster bacterium]
MKVSIPQIVRYADVDQDSVVRLPVLWSYLQEAAIYHSSHCGDGPQALLERGCVWVLHKIAMQVLDTAYFEDPIQITTWSRGSRGFKAFRDFVILSGEKEIARATSIWAYVSLIDGRPQRIPSDLMERYSVEESLAWDIDLEGWKPNPSVGEEFIVEISTRYQDFDTNGHMNNAVYLSLVETAIEKKLKKPPYFQEIKMQYNRSVSPETEMVKVGLRSNATEKLEFKIFDSKGTFACGDCHILQ